MINEKSIAPSHVKYSRKLPVIVSYTQLQKMLRNAYVLFISIVMQHAGFQEVNNKVKFYFKRE